MSEFGFHTKNVVVPNPTRLENFTPVSDDAEKKLLKEKLGFSPNTLLYAGRIADEKNVDTIIKAVALAQKIIPDIFFAITGHGSAEEKLKKLVVELGIEKNVRFFGFVDTETYPLFYKASDIFVIMSRAESQSLSLMNAMATGLPVIGANARALPEYITEECGYIVELGDFKALSEIFVKLFKDRSLVAQLGEGSQKQVAKFSTEIITGKWEDTYHTYARS